jgi:hypothetical protein
MELLTTFPWSLLGLLVLTLLGGLYLSNQDLLEESEDFQEETPNLSLNSSHSKKKFCKNSSPCP